MDKEILISANEYKKQQGVCQDSADKCLVLDASCDNYGESIEIRAGRAFGHTKEGYDFMTPFLLHKDVL